VVTETSNLFLVIAGGKIRVGNLGRHALTENQLLKILETMKNLTGIVLYKVDNILFFLIAPRVLLSWAEKDLKLDPPP
jgi:hypothetical protein